MLVDFLHLSGETEIANFNLNVLGRSGNAFLGQKSVGFARLCVSRSGVVGSKENILGFEVTMNKMPLVLEKITALNIGKGS